MIKKIANQCATFDGKGKLTVDDLYSVIKVQVPLFIAIYFPNVGLQWLDLEKNQVISPYVTNILVYVYFIDFVD